jgi:EmrB/QacA subfamily drug resistance transporter
MTEPIPVDRSDDRQDKEGAERPAAMAVGPQRSGERSHRLIIFGIVAIALFISTVDATIVATALPAIHHSLNATINWAGWVITIYGLGLVVSLPIAGKFSTQYGCRRVLLCGVVVFTVASVLCGASTSIYMLIVFRAVQSLGGGALMPASAGLVSDHFGSARDRAIGMFGTVLSAGQIVGPLLGGFFVGYLSWRWIFFVNVPIGIVLFFLIARLIPESVLRATTKTDVRGLLLLTSGILACIFGITVLGTSNGNVHTITFVVSEVCALCLLVFFVRHIKRVPEPFVSLRLLRGRGFAVVNTESFLLACVTFGVASLVPLYAQNRYHLPALGSGTLLTARAIGMIAVGALATMALRRTGYRLPMGLGMGIVAVGTVVMSIAPRWGVSPYAWLAVGAGITGVGVGMTTPASRNASLQLAPDEVAAITGLRMMFLSLGVIFWVSVSTAILNRAANPGMTQAYIMWVAVAIIIVVMIPLVWRIPDHKGSW